jgi:hypothetical protein
MKQKKQEQVAKHSNNFVAKHMNTFCKAQTMTDRKKEAKYGGKAKHKVDYKKDLDRSF